MRVRAIATGFYQGQIRNPGAEFVLTPQLVLKDGKQTVIQPEDQFSHVWMVSLDGPPPAKKRKGSWEETLQIEEEQAKKALEQAIQAGVAAGMAAKLTPPPPSVHELPPLPPLTEQPSPEEPTGKKQVI